jgi:hypothetical protein
MNDKWMKDLQKLGDDYTKIPPEGLLDDIKREMAARGLHVVQPRRRAVVIPLWQRIAIAAGIAAIVGVATLNYMLRPDATKPMVSQIQNNTETAPRTGTETTDEATVGEDSGWAGRAGQDIHGRAQHGSSGSLLATIGNATAEPNSGEQVYADEASRQAETDRPTADATSGDNNRQEVSKTGQKRAQATPRTTIPYTTDRHPSYRNAPRQDQWSVAALYSGALALNSTNASAPTGMNVMANDPIIPTLLKLSAEDAKRLSAADVPPVKHEKHHRPIKVGLSVQYKLDDRWSLQTGLTYSRLTSDFTEESMSYTETTKQKLHYIGIPVSLTYSVWRDKNINVYVKAGGEVEKLVKGSATTLHIDEEKGQTQRSADVHEHRPVFSTHAAGGVEYQLGQVVGVYVEPGLDYHIKNGSGVTSSYTDKPLNVNLNVGARIHF